jgi:transcriptional regulator with XRE-family HTH domain
MNIGENISNLRKEKNLTQEELAKLINVSSKTISSYETNRSIPNIEILILLSKVLDTDINKILGLNNENNKEIKQLYEKKNIKDVILKTLIIGIICVIPVFFFWEAGYVSVASFAAQILTYQNKDITEIAKQAMNVFNYYLIEYCIYLIINLINYLLYKKMFEIPLFIINIIIFLFIIISIIINGYITPSILIFIIASIIGIIEGVKVLKTRKSN